MQFTFHHDILAKEDKPKSYLIPFCPTYPFPYLTIFFSFILKAWTSKNIIITFPTFDPAWGLHQSPLVSLLFLPGRSECTLLCKFIAIQVITLQCILSTGQCTLYSVHCTLYNVQCTLYTLQCTLYNVQCTIYTV